MRRVLSAFTLLLGAAGCLSFHPGPLPGAPDEARFTRVSDTHVRFVDRAPDEAAKRSGRTVVLVHGYGASIEEWAALIPVLTKAGHRVIALDLRGHGWSSRPEGDYSIPGQARLVLDLLDQLEVDSFALVGHSWGSAVSLTIALQAPERVQRIVLYNGMFFEDQSPVVFDWARVPLLGELLYGVFYRERQDEKMAFAFFEPETHVSEHLVERLELFMDRPGTMAAALAGVRAMSYVELEASYPRLGQPVLVLWGREDQITPLEYGERLQARLPNVRFVVVPRCGHMPMLEVPGASSRHVVDFLEVEEDA